MAFIDDVVQGAQKAGKFICDKAEDAKDFVSLEYKSVSLKNKIDEQYRLLGEFVYSLSESGEEDGGKTQEIVDIINGYKAELSEVNEQMSKFKSVCPECKTPVSNGANFCKKCGAKLK